MAGRGWGRGRGLLSSNVTAVAPGSGDYQALLVKLGHIRTAEEEKNKEHNGDQNAKSPSPSPSPSLSTTTLSDVEEALRSLQLDADESDLKKINELATDATKSGEDLKKVAEMIYKKCLGDRDFAKSGAIICHLMAGIEVEGTRFRNCILSLLQKDFKDKEEIRKTSSVRFLGFLATLCQVFDHMRTATGELFKPLVGPICESMEMILEQETDTTADECEFLTLQLQAVGKEIDDIGSERLGKLMEKVRTKIVNNGTSPRIRCTLLEVLECYCRRFEEPPNDVTRFYCDTMADILSGMVV
ncbi:CBP80/20-dependent translation initiation factor-like [Haliotis rubra]|uniref:CBP80/20-dependent translation initiation factor-like n=1 Tax=Haliotis rubra TaxID=36100 RepID=UPI001EE533CE|nr:CBP80/20-dependent translation initiation factor-like [Haliotis rubra]XP_046544989.1 CBP80/20-dependent translation initiation factor-like [Haliotis rubra]